MKLIHLSDLHLGKRVNEFSMLEDQAYILGEIIQLIDQEHPDAVLIAGDIYDKSVPSAEAVELFDSFLVRLAKRKLQVFAVSGNHDSPERIAFASRLIDGSGVHLSPVYHGTITPAVLTDQFGPVHIYMLPFIKPVHVRRQFPDREINSYTDAAAVAIEAMDPDPTVRNVLIAHQFVTGATRSDSEEVSVGGLDNVDASVFAPFDYVALGHIHSPQNISSEHIRYCGTPLKYSFSEAAQKKSVTVVELGKKGNLSVRTLPLQPKRDMVELKGTYEELTSRAFYENTTYREDYVHITLTDEDVIMNALGKLRVIYKNVMKLDYDNTRTRHSAVVSGDDTVQGKDPNTLFSEFYQLQNNAPMSDQQAEYMRTVIEKIWEGEP